MEDFEMKVKIDGNESIKTLKDLRKELKEVYDLMVNFEEGSDAFLALANKAGTLKHLITEIGEAAKGASADFGDMLGNVTKAAAGITGTFQVLQGSLNLLGIESEEVTESIKTMQSMMAITQGLASIDSGIKALDKLKTAITGTTVVAKALRAALTPKTILAVVAAVTALTYAYEKLTAKSREAAKAREEEAKKAKAAADAYNNDIGNAAKNLLLQYDKLRISFEKLKSLSEKQSWIEKNKTEFNKLGISINNVKDAENAFVKNSKKMIEAFRLRAEAAAYEKLATDKYADYIIKLENALKNLVKAGSKAKSFNVNDEKAGNVKYLSGSGYVYTEKGAEQKNKQILNSDELNNAKKAAEDYTTKVVELTEKVNTLVGTGSAATIKASESVKVKDDELTTLRNAYELEKARLDLRREQGDQSAQDEKYYQSLIDIQLKYRVAVAATGKATEMDLINIDTAIAKTNNTINEFLNGNGEESEEGSELETKLQNINTAIAQAEAVFAASELTLNDEITRLLTIISYEEQRLELMRQMGEEGSEGWYNQVTAIEGYKKELKNASKTTKDWKSTALNAAKVASAGFNAVGGILNQLASNQDLNTKEGFERSKKMNIAGATMSMLAGITEILAGTFTTKSGPWDIALAAIQAAALLASGIMNINQIKSTTFDGGGNASSASTASANISSSAITLSFTPAVQQVNDVVGAETLGQLADNYYKVYVSETDLRRVSNKVSVQETENIY